MTCKEKQVCIECGDYKNCPYVSRNLEHKCQHLSDIMYGFELGYKDAIDNACEWVEKFAYNSVVTDNIGEREKQAIIITFKEHMEEQQ